MNLIHGSSAEIKISSMRWVSFQFMDFVIVYIFNVRQSCARYSYRLGVCPSVCLSVRHTLVFIHLI